MNKSKKVGSAIVAWMAVVNSQVFCSANQVEQTLENAAKFIIPTIGGGVMLLALIFGGLAISAGNRDGVKRSGYAIIGGLVVILAPSLIEIATGWAG